MNTDNNDAVTQLTNEAAAEAMPWKCPKCTKRFTNKAGLSMHNGRVHAKNIVAAGQKGFKPNPANKKRKTDFPSNSPAVKRRKYQQARDRYHAMGLDAKGRPFKTDYGRRTSLAMRGKGPVVWTPERRAKFKATLRRKEREKAMTLFPGSLKAKKRIQFVYPTPGSLPDIRETLDKAVETPVTTAIRFCPHCGNNIERHLS